MAEACSHEGCTCEARADGYCSDYCAQQSGAGHREVAGDHEGHECHCGHAACEEVAATG